MQMVKKNVFFYFLFFFESDSMKQHTDFWVVCLFKTYIYYSYNDDERNEKVKGKKVKFNLACLVKKHHAPVLDHHLRL